MAKSPALHPLGDLSAIALSGLCLIHCLALPLLMSMLPWLAWLDGHAAWIHAWLLMLIAPLSAWALSRGCRQHGRRPVLYAGLLAISALVAAVVVAPRAPALEAPLTLLGSVMLVSIHVWNLRMLARRRLRAISHV